MELICLGFIILILFFEFMYGLIVPLFKKIGSDLNLFYAKKKKNIVIQVIHLCIFFSKVKRPHRIPIESAKKEGPTFPHQKHNGSFS